MHNLYKNKIGLILEIDNFYLERFWSYLTLEKTKIDFSITLTINNSL